MTEEEPSYATARKIRIIESRMGSNWRDTHPSKSIDAIYNTVVGDVRKNLFCKIDPETKRKLDEMVIYYDMKMAEFIEQVIDREYEFFIDKKNRRVQEVARDFSGR